jgi:hypothetical protein
LEAAMGGNTRYPDHRLAASIDWARIRPQPRSITREEAGLDTDPLREGTHVTVWAWVHFPVADGSDVVLQVEATAEQWNGRAVLCTGLLFQANPWRALLWAGAVTRRRGRQPPEPPVPPQSKPLLGHSTPPTQGQRQAPFREPHPGSSP